MSLKKLSFYKNSNSYISRMAWPILKRKPILESGKIVLSDEHNCNIAGLPEKIALKCLILGPFKN